MKSRAIVLGVILAGVFGVAEAKAEWVRCAYEGGYCRVPYPTVVRYGARGAYSEAEVGRGVSCSNRVFGDPIEGVHKTCWFAAGGYVRREVAPPPVYYRPPPPPPVYYREPPPRYDRPPPHYDRPPPPRVVDRPPPPPRVVDRPPPPQRVDRPPPQQQQPPADWELLRQKRNPGDPAR